jgi:hypothetical protein
MNRERSSGSCGSSVLERGGFAQKYTASFALVAVLAQISFSLNRQRGSFERARHRDGCGATPSQTLALPTIARSSAHSERLGCLVLVKVWDGKVMGLAFLRLQPRAAL